MIVGDVPAVRPGEQVPVDGVIVRPSTYARKGRGPGLASDEVSAYATPGRGEREPVVRRRARKPAKRVRVDHGVESR